MDPIARMVAAGAAGAAGGDPTYVDDVFSTFLYEASGSTQAINNGIDLAGEGGMVWIKNRANGSSYTNNTIVDSERGANSYGYRSIYPNLTETQYEPTSSSNAVATTFNSDGFTRGGNLNVGVSGGDYVSWTFRKAPGFFDVVTYTGSSSVQTISHNLGSVPGMILIKNLDSQYDWAVYHRSTGNSNWLRLNTTAASASSSSYWNNTTPTSTHFTIGTNSTINQSGASFVAYIFAHDDQSFGTNSDEAIIKCGSYTGNGSSSGPVIDLGFEPQFVLLRCTLRSGGHGGGWYLLDSMRGIPTGARNNSLQAQESNAEDGFSNNPGAAANMDLTPTGFQLTSDANSSNQSGANYIYMAIRRPHKPPTDATEVFNVMYLANGSTNLGFVADTNISKYPAGTQEWYWNSRLTGDKDLNSNNSGAEDTAQPTYWDLPTNTVNFGSYTGYHVNYVFRRAPGFFDVVAYTGTGSAMTINHNLGATPELLIVKKRSSSGTWWTYSSVTSNNAFMKLEDTVASESSTNLWNNTTPSSTTFSLGSNNNVVSNGSTYIAYLFASQSGVSKVGSYTGTGSNINVDCGFTAGARFVMIKRTDSTGHWFVFDTARGITESSSPWIALNSTLDQQTGSGNNFIDPHSSGFTVDTSVSSLNENGGTYLFLAIA